MKRLALTLALTFIAKLSLLAQCHGAAAVIGDHIDANRARLHIYAVMQCDDGRQVEFRSREGIVTPETPRPEIARLIYAMAQETVDYFAAAGCPSDIDDLIRHLSFKDDESSVTTNHPYRLKYAPPIPPKTYPPMGASDE